MSAYFGLTLDLHKKLQTQTAAANALLSSASVNASLLREIFAPHSMQILCDGRDADAGIII